jgi:hypothetical protein
MKVGCMSHASKEYTDAKFKSSHYIQRTRDSGLRTRLGFNLEKRIKQ